jgi:hypothetical protein
VEGSGLYKTTRPKRRKQGSEGDSKFGRWLARENVLVAITVV